MTDAVKSARWRAANREKVLLDNASRRKRADRRSGNIFAMIHHWVKSRCENKGQSRYRYYGGLGIECRITQEDIAICWLRDRGWQMERPELDRIDPTGHYEFTNIQFLEKLENLERRRRPRRMGEREPGVEG